MKSPISLWIAAERKRKEWKLEELARRVRELGLQAEDSTVRTWEAGRAPRQTTVEALETLFGSKAPPRDGAGGDLAGLVAALTAQTEAITRRASGLTRDEAAQLIEQEMAPIRASVRRLEGWLARIAQHVGVPAGPDTPPAATAPRKRGRRLEPVRDGA